MRAVKGLTVISSARASQKLSRVFGYPPDMMVLPVSLLFWVMRRSVLFGLRYGLNYPFGLSAVVVVVVLLHSLRNATNVYKAIVHVPSNRT